VSELTEPRRALSATTVLPEAVRRCAAALADAADATFAALADLANEFIDAWTAADGTFGSDQMTAVQPAIFRQLDAQSSFESAGFVLTSDALTDRQRHLEWWQRGANRTYQPLILDVEPGTADCYDYYSMEWFAAAVTDRQRFVSGPLIDLPCADVYIMTFSLPMNVGPLLLGVAAADVGLARFESSILPPLRQIGAPAVLLNREHRVISSNDSRWATGLRLRGVDDDPAEWPVVTPVGQHLAWTLAVNSG
jgi:hypothetical protein